MTRAARKHPTNRAQRREINKRRRPYRKHLHRRHWK